MPCFQGFAGVGVSWMGVDARGSAAPLRHGSIGVSAHPDAHCDVCGRLTWTIWLAPDDLWRDFNDGRSEGMACADCFVRWALNERGIVVRFRVEVCAPSMGASSSPATGGLT